MAGRLTGKVAIITGAASGIGKATAEAFVAEGAKVIASDIDDVRGAALQEAHPGELVYVRTDVTSEADIAAAVAAAVSEFGRLDVIFNNAGAQGDPSGVLDITPEGFDKTMALLIRSAVIGTKHAGAQFVAQGGGGAIISTASAAAIQGGWSALAYTVAKHAVLGLTRQAAAELGAHGIRVNAVAPGIIKTPIMARSVGLPEESAEEFTDFLEEKLGAGQPVGRLGTPEDIAKAVVWLASDDSTFVTGEVLTVDGGATSIYGGDFARDMGETVAAFGQR